MKKLLLFAAILCFCSCAQDLDTRVWNEGINLIPYPEKIQVTEDHFTLRKGMTIQTNIENCPAVQIFADQIEIATGIRLESTHTEGDILIDMVPADDKDESYLLSVRPDRIQIRAQSQHGVHNALATLMQLFPAEISSPEKVRATEWTVPCVEIEDRPRFSYRGIMIDVARHFLPKEDLLRQIDVLGSLKINKLHLHLSDNQGWRLEFKKYPVLTEIGGKRIEGDGTEYGGFYTQDEMKEIVRYAADRFITIIPEFDLPAHAEAACVAVPELSCTGEVHPVRNYWGPDPLVMCPGKEFMFGFYDDLFKELIEIFPSEYYHIGGDECNKRNWEACSNCQKRIQEEGLKDDKEFTAEQRLQSYTMKRIETILQKYGKKVIGWDEILQGGLSQSATVMSWRGESGGIAAAAKGNHAIMCPHNKGLYLDYVQGQRKIEPATIGGNGVLSHGYSYEPITPEIERTGSEDFIIGMQANLWSEYMYSPELFEYALYPRVQSLAEISWRPRGERDFEDFCRRLENNTMRLHLNGINFHIPLPEMKHGPLQTIAFQDKASVDFTTTRPIKVVYTTDGTTPGTDSPVWNGPMDFTQNTTLKVASVMENGLMSDVLTYQIEKQTPLKATVLNNPVQGLQFKRTPAKGEEPAQLIDITEWENHPRWARDLESFERVATGYLKVPSTGNWCFSTLLEKLYIDGELVVDNTGEVKNWPRKESSIALEAGYHQLEAVFHSNYIGGYPAFWNKGEISWKKTTEKNYTKINEKEYCHEQ